MAHTLTPEEYTRWLKLVEADDARKEYMITIKDSYNAKKICECGANIIWRNREAHYKTKKHILAMAPIE